jgi:uncharacterized membrane protein
MSFRLFLKIFLILAPIMLFVDYIWLKFIARSFFMTELAGFETSLRIIPVFIVYLLMPVGIILFVSSKAGNNIVSGLAWGAVFGVIMYGVFDLTNYAILEKWTLKFICLDILWGLVLNSTMSGLGTYLLKVFSK